MDDAAHRAQGVALAVLEALLIAKGVLQPGELSDHLDNIVQVTAETDTEAADILDDWAQMLAQVDAAHRTTRQ